MTFNVEGILISLIVVPATVAFLNWADENDIVGEIHKRLSNFFKKEKNDEDKS